MPRFAFLRIIIVAAAAALVLAGVAWRLRPRGWQAPENPLLTTPVLAVEAAGAKAVYFNAAARAALGAKRPELVAADRDGSFAQATQNPKLFRKLDREHRFEALLLAGDPSWHRPLLEHLLETKDFSLAYLDHAAVIFRRDGAAAWSPAALDAIEARFPTERERACFLAQAAGKMLALRMRDEARGVLEKAERLDAGVPDVWSGWATYRMLRGEWQQALAAVDRALAIDAEFLPAMAARTQVLFSTRKFHEALKLSTRILERAPDDASLLFYHAKIAHEARDFGTEIGSLTRLIALAEKGGMPVAGYRIYLAQAYAADRQAVPAIEHFTKVLADPELSPEQRKFAEETLAQIKERAKL